MHYGDRPSFCDVDIVFVGGGSDREQKVVCEQLLAVGGELQSYVEDGASCWQCAAVISCLAITT